MTQPTSMPAPVQRALQLAARGRSDMEEYIKQRNLDAARNELRSRTAQNQELVNKRFTA